MAWWQYLLLVNIYLSLFYGFYALLLGRETFFQLNRVYLIGSAMLSFMAPLIQAQWARNLFITQRINQTIYHLHAVNVYQVQLNVSPNAGITFGQGLAIIYLVGMLFLLARFGLQLVLLHRSLNINSSNDAYSFFKRIKLSDKLVNRGVIMAHEQVHARQWHSADVLFIEGVTIINWFNPAVYFYRSAIKHIHEFIADRDALKTGTGKQAYALLLLSETFKTPVHQLLNPFFNHSLLKQRIIMLQKDHSRRAALIKYGLSAPLFAIMVILSSAMVKTNKAIASLNERATEVMLMQAAPLVTDALMPPKNINTDVATLGVKDFMPQPKSPPVPAAGIAGKNLNRSFYTTVSHSAELPGGIDAFAKFLAENVKITPEIKATLPQKPVIVQFIVEKDGSLSDIHTLRGSGPTAAEAIRVISQSPKWKPGKQNGKLVRQQYNVPISFTLAGQQKAGAASKIKTDDRALFTLIAQSAEFPGGLTAFAAFLGKNIKITPEIQSKLPFAKAICQFVVEEDGGLSDIKVLRGTGVPAADLEALRVLAMSPKWKPGIQNGRSVRQQYTVPISFSKAEVQKVGAANTTPFKRPKASAQPGINHAVYVINGKQVDKGLNGISPDKINSLAIFRSKTKGAKGARDTIKVALKSID